MDEGTLTATVSNNDIRDFRERGIYTQMSEDNSGNNAMNLNITNTIVNRDVPEHAILVQGGALTGYNGTYCANVT